MANLGQHHQLAVVWDIANTVHVAYIINVVDVANIMENAAIINIVDIVKQCGCC